MRTFPLPALLLCALAAPAAQADILNAGDTLCIEFTVSSSLSQVPDVLVLNFGLVQVNQFYTSRSAALYDGNTLLGTDTKNSFGFYTGTLSLNPSNGFVDPNSTWIFKNPAVIDFTTIANGSIQGRIEFTIQTGQMDIPLGQVNVRLGRGIGTSSFLNVTPDPVITSIGISTGGGCAETSVGTDYCFGSGSGSPCPCGNFGGPSQGCANSSGQGAVLSASGSNVIANNDLVFVSSNLLPGQPVLLFAGNNAVNGGLGNTFGDGLRCAGGAVARLGVRIPDAGGAASWGPGVGSGLWNPGDVRRFQSWYRDPIGSPCGTGFNLSNGLEIAFN